MDSFLVGFKALFDTLGSTVMLPIIIFFFAIILGTKPGRAFRSAVVIGVAFIGIGLIIGLLWGSIDGVAKAMVAGAGIERDIIDVGWPAAAAIAFGSDVGLWVIPIALLVNVVLLATRMTKTLNVDVWNFWHFAFAGSLVTAVTGDLAMGIVAAALAAALMLFFADWTAPAVQDFYNLPGISIPHGTSTAYVALAIPINLLLDRIPGVKDWDADPEAIEKRFGPTFGDPMVLGLLIGIVLGLIGYWGEFASVGFLETFAKIMLLGVNLAAVMVLLPRMVSLLMEGLIPISEAAREFMQKRASDREIYIGLDSAILIGHPAVISASLVLVPIAILLSIILPGNRMILAADLAVFPFVIALTGPITKGNVVRMIIIGTIIIAVGFYIGNAMAPMTTQAAAEAGFAMPEGATQISSVADGFIWIPFAFMVLGGNMQWVGLAIFAVLIGLFWFFYNRNSAAWEAAAGGPPVDAAEAAAAD